MTNGKLKTKVLVVEDEGPVALGLCNRLETMGYDVPKVAVSGEEAISMASEIDPDVVLMDIRLQGEMDGVDAASRIRSRSHVPVIYLTAYADDKTVRRAQRTEPFGYLTKPIRDLELRASIEMAIYKNRMEQQLRASEKSYAATIHSIGDGLIAVDREGRVTLMNPVAERLTGWTQTEAIGHPLTEVFSIVNEQTRQPMAPPTQRALELGIAVGVESHALLQTRNGQETPITDCAAPIQTEDGLLGAVLVFHDVSEFRRVEESLRQHAAEIEDLYNNAPCGYHSLDAEGMFVRVNETMLRWLGYTREELVGRIKFSEIMTPASRRTFENYFPAFRERGRLSDVEYELVKKDGGVMPVLLNASATMDHDGHYIMSRVTLYDLTERKRAEQEHAQIEAQLQHSQRLESLGVLAAGVAHDLNNLLTGVLGYAELANLEISPGSTVSGYLGQIITGGRQLAELTRQLLAYAGKGSVSMQPIDLSQFTRATADVLRPSLREKCSLEYQFSETIPLIQADPAKIRQIVTNLIVNARDACEARGGIITIRTGVRECDSAFLATCHIDGDLPPGPYVYLEVADTGSGMDTATRARIFDPFFTTKFTGRGLGLAAVLGIIRSHHGTIKVVSELGQGSTFTVFFPTFEPVLRRGGAKTASTKDWHPSGTVLLVDDDRVARDLTSALLTRMGFSVVETADGDSAVEYFRSNFPQVRAVVLDLTMPGRDGVETFHELNRICPTVPVVLCSGFGSDYCRQLFSGVAPAAFMDKPHRYEGLKAALRRVLQEAPQSS